MYLMPNFQKKWCKFNFFQIKFSLGLAALFIIIILICTLRLIILFQDFLRVVYKIEQLLYIFTYSENKLFSFVYTMYI